jgi:ribosomal protein S27AE
MADFHPRCPKCDKSMDLGHIPDAAHGVILQSSWAPGEPETRRFIGGIKYHADELIPISAYRCPACGYVEFFARPART